MSGSRAKERFVVDASVAIKWVVPETGSEDAVGLLDYSLTAPDLICAECANILWKKVSRGELSSEEAEIAAQGLENAEISLSSSRANLASALSIAVALDHPADDCIYLALAQSLSLRLVTADQALVRKIGRSPLRDHIVALSPAPS